MMWYKAEDKGGGDPTYQDADGYGDWTGITWFRIINNNHTLEAHFHEGVF